MSNAKTDQDVVLRVNSHRAGSKLATALGRKPQYSWTVKPGDGFVILSNFVILTRQEADAVLPITGITRSRVDPRTLAPCL